MIKERELHLRDYLNVVRKRKYAVFTVFILIFVVFLVGTMSRQKTFMATTKVLIERNEPRVSMMNFYYAQAYDPEFYSTQYQLIKSTSVGRRVVEKLSLDKNYDSYFKDKKGSGPAIGISGLFSRAQNAGAVRWIKGVLGFKTKSASTSDMAVALRAGAQEFVLDVKDVARGAEASARKGDLEFALTSLDKALIKEEGLSSDISADDLEKNRYYLFRIKAMGGCIPEDFINRIGGALRFTSSSEGSVAGRIPEVLVAGRKLVYEEDACGGRKGAVLFKGVLSVGKDFAPQGLAVELSIAESHPETPDTAQTDAPPPPPSRQEKIHSLSKIIARGIIVSPVTNSRVVKISYRSPNPKLASLIANTVAEAYIDYIFEMKMNSSRHKLKWLTAKSEEERWKLEASEKALQDYMKRNDIITLENRVAIVPQRLVEFGSQLIKAESRRKELQTLYSRVTKSGEDIEFIEFIPAISSRSTIGMLRDEILNAEQNVIELSKKYGKKHPVRISAIEDLEVLKKRRKDELRRAVKSLGAEYELAKSSEKNIRALLSRTKLEVLDLNEKFIQYGALQRDVETNKQLYYAIIRNIKERDIIEEMQTVDVWVVEKAETPKNPVRPKKSYNILIGLLIGLVGGVGMAFFVEYLDNTIKTPDELETKLGLPVLGMVSFLKKKETIEGIVQSEPRSVVSENYKSIRTAILLSSADTPPKNILITSASPKEGKTATAVNLAETIALSEHSVLLVDSDLRKPRVHKIFSIDNSSGLSTYLAGISELNFVQSGTLGNLKILPSGPVPPNPSELLTSNRLGEMLRAVSGMFDFIIWDSPPLLSVTDGLILSKRLDGTILVSWAGKTTYDELRRTMKAIEDIKATITGVVINAVDLRKGYYYDYKYYNYYYSEKNP